MILQSGFRIFFLGAALYTILSIAFWMCFYIFGLNIFVALPVNVWHGHEMIYGFTMAVVAGFLLTAVTNWTERQTLTKIPLLILFAFWSAGRVFAFMPGDLSFPLMSLCDNIFLVYLLFGVTRPVVEAKHWKAFAVLSKVILILICSILFYFSLKHNSLRMTHMGLTFTVYMVISLILTISRRVIPFFVERGVGYPVTLRNSKFLDLSSMCLLIIFSIGDVFAPRLFILPAVTSALALIHILRLSGWFTPGVCKKPLLWVLFLGYAFIIIGFILKTIAYISAPSPDYALHAFTYGGIGIMCLGMMSRVSWAHTGRNINEPPSVLPLMFAVLFAGACARVFMPILDAGHFPVWIAVSQFLWIIAYGLFIVVYFPVLSSPRIDGKFG